MTALRGKREYTPCQNLCCPAMHFPVQQHIMCLERLQCQSNQMQRLALRDWEKKGQQRASPANSDTLNHTHLHFISRTGWRAGCEVRLLPRNTVCLLVHSFYTVLVSARAFMDPTSHPLSLPKQIAPISWCLGFFGGDIGRYYLSRMSSIRCLSPWGL